MALASESARGEAAPSTALQTIAQARTDAGEASVGARFGAAVRRLREARGWSQERLAAQAELNRSYMGEIERAAVMPSLATAAKLARALDTPLWQLLQHCEAGTEA